MPWSKPRPPSKAAELLARWSHHKVHVYVYGCADPKGVLLQMDVQGNLCGKLPLRTNSHLLCMIEEKIKTEPGIRTRDIDRMLRGPHSVVPQEKLTVDEIDTALWWLWLKGRVYGMKEASASDASRARWLFAPKHTGSLGGYSLADEAFRGAIESAELRRLRDAVTANPRENDSDMWAELIMGFPQVAVDVGAIDAELIRQPIMPCASCRPGLD